MPTPPDSAAPIGERRKRGRPARGPLRVQVSYVYEWGPAQEKAVSILTEMLRAAKIDYFRQRHTAEDREAA